MDDRGKLMFVNNFDFAQVKRFYVVEDFSTSVVRAFHGHKREAKFVFVMSGAAIVAAVKIDDFENPGKSLPIYRFVLSEDKPSILYVPPGFANGHRSLKNNTKVIFFSSSTLEESKGDDFRFPINFWGNDIWEVENR